MQYPRANRPGEKDMTSGWRKVACWIGRPGVTKWIKRQMHKRERRDIKQRLQRRDES